MLWFLDTSTLLAFVTAGVLLNLTPGSDVAFTVATALKRGTGAGLMAGFGITLGSFTHASLAALGLAALIAANPALFEALRWLGATYLIWLAYQAWTARAAGQTSAALGTPFLQGYLTNILNPKVALFMLAFLPHFTDPSAGALAQQFLTLGAIFCTSGVIIISGYALLAGRARALMASRETLINRISALILGGLAARLVTS